MCSPLTLQTREIPGGNRKLVFSECGEYLVIDMQHGKLTRLETFEERDFVKAATDYKEGA